MTGFQPVQSLFPNQGASASGILGGTGLNGTGLSGTGTTGEGAADLFTQLLSGMVDTTAADSQSTGQASAFLNAGQGTGTAKGGGQFTSSTIPFATGKTAGGTSLKASATTGAAVAALMTGMATNSPAALQPAAGWTQTHWSAKTDATDTATVPDTGTGTAVEDDTPADTTLAALAAMGTQQPPTPPAPVATQAASVPAVVPQAASAGTAAVQAAEPSQTTTSTTTTAAAGLPATAQAAAQPATALSAPPLPGMTPVDEPTAADAALAAQAVQALQASQGDAKPGNAKPTDIPPATPANGSAAAAAAASLAVADQKAAALATGTPPTSTRTSAATATAPTNTALATQAQAGTAADSATLAATAAAAIEGAPKAAKTDGASGSGLKTGGQAKGVAKGDGVKLAATTVSVTTASQDKLQATATADQARQQAADTATDGDGSNGILAAPATDGMLYADAHAATIAPMAAPGAKISDTATPAAAMTLPNANANTGAATTAQATLQALLQQQQAGTAARAGTASNGLITTAENGLLPASGAEATGATTSASDAALNASGFMGLVDGQHTFPTGGFAAQFAATGQAARQVQYPPVLQQVTMGFQKAASNGMDSVTIQLTPDDMGSIDVKLDFHKDGKVRATVTADNAKTLDLLQRNSDDLKNALQDAGLQTDNDSLSFNLKDDDQAQQQQERRSGQSGAQFSIDDTTATEAAPSENTIIPSLGRVDVRI
ncbi:flagellar hook-length control protein FliK [Azospirillum sp. B4]|uniref:flagellar hook-length control protein FliK n=1 Tax=Azospirillum sp. B4 TaxID=95605 RepID=UPI00034828BE|nr:flagellar hook-length control protein FliK [Azospirillum sp. B4]